MIQMANLSQMPCESENGQEAVNSERLIQVILGVSKHVSESTFPCKQRFTLVRVLMVVYMHVWVVGAS